MPGLRDILQLSGIWLSCPWIHLAGTIAGQASLQALLTGFLFLRASADGAATLDAAMIAGRAMHGQIAALAGLSAELTRRGGIEYIRRVLLGEVPLIAAHGLPPLAVQPLDPPIQVRL